MQNERSCHNEIAHPVLENSVYIEALSAESQEPERKENLKKLWQLQLVWPLFISHRLQTL